MIPWFAKWFGAAAAMSVQSVLHRVCPASDPLVARTDDAVDDEAAEVWL